MPAAQSPPNLGPCPQGNSVQENNFNSTVLRTVSLAELLPIIWYPCTKQDCYHPQKKKRKKIITEGTTTKKCFWKPIPLQMTPVLRTFDSNLFISYKYFFFTVPNTEEALNSKSAVLFKNLLDNFSSLAVLKFCHTRLCMTNCKTYA